MEKNGRKKAIKTTIPLVLILAMVGVATALVTYTFYTPQAEVYPTPISLDFSSKWNQTYYFEGDTAKLEAILSNPNKVYDFQITSIVIKNEGTANIKLWLDAPSNYVLLNAGQSITLTPAMLSGIFSGGEIHKDTSYTFTAYADLLSSGTLQLSAQINGNWGFNA